MRHYLRGTVLVTSENNTAFPKALLTFTKAISLDLGISQKLNGDRHRCTKGAVHNYG